MSYIGSDGTIQEGSGPLTVRVVNFFWDVVNAVVAFFQTLIPGFGEDSHNQTGYGLGSSRAPRYPPGPRKRNVRGFGRVSSFEPPPCGGGS